MLKRYIQLSYFSVLSALFIGFLSSLSTVVIVDALVYFTLLYGIIAIHFTVYTVLTLHYIKKVIQSKVTISITRIIEVKVIQYKNAFVRSFTKQMHTFELNVIRC